MLRSARTALLRLGRAVRMPDGAGAAAREGGTVRLPLPETLPASLGCDAVGVPARHGFRLMARMPRTGCVFADRDWWWWIVPAGSDLELSWPAPALYVRGISVPAVRPRLIHWPDDRTPYTPPIPFYLMVCQLAGTAPAWAEGPLPAPPGGARA